MCSLFGFLDYQGLIPHRIIKKMTQALANAAEERGVDASGISYVMDGEVVVYKRPKPAHKLHFNPPNGVRAVMGHTRLSTQGSEKHNINNHPFLGHAGIDFAFAHNGCLYNDKSLREEKQLPATNIHSSPANRIKEQARFRFSAIHG